MHVIHRWQQQYLGTTTLPKTLGTAELQAFFVYSKEELDLIRTRRTAPLRIAAAIQLRLQLRVRAAVERAVHRTIRLGSVCIPGHDRHGEDANGDQ